MYRNIPIYLLSASLALAQSPPPAFEVASVKSAIPGETGGRIQFLPGGTFRGSNVSLNYLIQQVYGMRDFQIVGDPRWLAIIADGHDARYEIQAKGKGIETEAQMKEMVKTLLAERFQLKLHKETRDLPVYALIPAKSGIKLQPTKETRGGGVAIMLRGWIQGSYVSMSELVFSLNRLADLPVIDKTNFTERFDFRLTFTPISAASETADTASNGVCPESFAEFQVRRGMPLLPASCPSLYTAVQEQLGLKLDEQKHPIEVLVINHIERPSAN